MIYPFRFDYLKLESEELPDKTKVTNGSTCYEVDSGVLYIAYNGEWYAQE